ncbi:MAG: hypothetical protein ACPGWR_22615, partial [Ardenticatenaceae bacterium]
REERREKREERREKREERKRKLLLGVLGFWLGTWISLKAYSHPIFSREIARQKNPSTPPSPPWAGWGPSGWAGWWLGGLVRERVARWAVGGWARWW